MRVGVGRAYVPGIWGMIVRGVAPTVRRAGALDPQDVAFAIDAGQGDAGVVVIVSGRARRGVT